ncbi:MAG: hypothetical protein R3C15_16195 [Thermoleophilia bacterium]
MSTAAAPKHESNRDGEQLQLQHIRPERSVSSPEPEPTPRRLRTLALLGEDGHAGALADLVRTGDADLEVLVGSSELLESGHVRPLDVDAILLDPALLADDDTALRGGFAQPLEPACSRRGSDRSPTGSASSGRSSGAPASCARARSSSARSSATRPTASS